MPRLRVLGRAWNVASDELFLPASLGAILHSVWMLASLINLIIILSTSSSHQHCTPQFLLYLYLFLNIIIASCLVAVEIMIAKISLKGTVCCNYISSCLFL